MNPTESAREAIFNFMNTCKNDKLFAPVCNALMDKERCADQLWEFFHDKETQKATIPGMYTSKVAFEKQCIELELYKVAEEIVNSNFIEEYNKIVKF